VDTLANLNKKKESQRGSSLSEIKDYYQLDKEETEILEAYYQGRLNGPPVPESMVAAAKQTLKTNTNINIRISENDLESIKLLAAREGMREFWGHYI
jgi:predicted DNA binding CopG/RHH family protein